MSYDSDIAESFRELKKSRTLKKVANLEISTKWLIESGVEFESKNGGTHLIILIDGLRFADFWPSTGKWKLRSSNKYNRGIKRLLGKIKDFKNNSCPH